MDTESILVSAAVGIATSAVTAYITTRLRMGEEREKWQRDFAIKYIEVQANDNALAQKMEIQAGIGFIKFRNPDIEPQKRFILPNYRLVVGRAPDSDICINDPRLSRQHCAFSADNANVFLEGFGATNPILLNDEPVRGKTKLKTGDVIKAGKTEFVFYKL